jgi:tetratricopeptide (TPR) repeat protein
VSEAIPAKHVLFMTDACYSGIAATRGGVQNYLQEVTKRNARQVITAGGADEEVADNGPNGHSIFTWTVMQGLDGRADLNNDGYITASELAAYVGPIVSSLSRQTPAFASLPGSEGGEFVFELKHENEFLSEQSTQLDEEAIKLNTELDRIRAALAAKRQRNEQLKQQIASAKAQLASAPTPVQPRTAAQHIDVGVGLFREKRYSDAQKSFMEALRLNPSNALAANNVGYTYAKMEQYDQAVTWFKKTLELDPRRAIAHANLGDAYASLGHNDEAKREYTTFLELQPSAKYASTVREKLQKLP